MRVLVATVGSTGDLKPFLALGRGLLAAGHEAIVFTARHFEPAVRRAGLAFCDSGSPASDAGYEEMLRAVMAGRNPLRQGARIFDQTSAEQLFSVEQARAATALADVVVAHSMDFAAIAACEESGRALLTSHLFPTLLEARDLSPTGRSF